MQRAKCEYNTDANKTFFANILKIIFITQNKKENTGSRVALE